MTKKMKLLFAMVSTVSALFIVMLSTPFAIDAGASILLELVNSLGLYEAPTLSALPVLIIPGLYLYLALGHYSILFQSWTNPLVPERGTFGDHWERNKDKEKLV